MRLRTGCMALILCVASSISVAANVDQPASVMTWLEGIDAGHYGESWDQTAPLFQQRLSREDWRDALNKARQPLGAVLARDESAVEDHTSLPGAPDGEYRVITYETRYVNKAHAVETVTLRKVAGEWRVIGYFIR